MSYTKGPWVAVECKPLSDDDLGGFRIDAPGVEQICFVWNTNRRLTLDGSAGPKFGSDQARGDAALITASPELLEALEELLIAEKLDDDDPRLEKARAMAAAALKKAKGAV